MAQPVWVTPAGSLGTIPEGVFYSTPLVAVEPELGDTVYYQLIAGDLPAGIQIQQTGLITGVPKAVATVQGVPEQVSRDVTSKFAVRAYTRRTVNGITVINRLADRTFEITVTGQDVPQWITPAGQIAQVFDGSLVEGIQLEYTDVDPDDTVVVKLVAGQLPPGLSLSAQGLISGFVSPNTSVTAQAGYSRDGQGYSQYPYDFSTQSIDFNYQFVCEVSDGKVGGTSLRTFSIFVWSRNSLTADNTVITADNTFITADGSPVRPPIILNPQGSIGTVRNDNFFAYQFNGIDLDGDQFDIVKTPSSTLPPGLTLDPNSGWLYGYIPNLGITELTYDFSLLIRKDFDPDVFTGPYDYSLSITGPVSSEIVWLTQSDLGTIANGSTSMFYVKATNTSGIQLQYRLLSGSNSNLPQGLQLLPGGDIAGRVSFNTFALDLGTTTFDVTKENGADPTTFDMKHTFTVNAFSSNGLINVSKTFSITVIREYNEPYENLYIQCMPPQDDRALITSLIQNSDIFQPDLIYRPQDPYFGVAKGVVYNHAYGLTAATVADYYSSLYENHYWKNLTLGEIRTAQALDPNTELATAWSPITTYTSGSVVSYRGNNYTALKNIPSGILPTDTAYWRKGRVLYEVVYSQIIDDLVNNDDVSVNKQVQLAFPVDYGDNLVDVTTVYPNSLVNMRDQVIDVVGQISNILPLWMTSKQANGQVLGFTPAWVLAYIKPGQAERVAYYIRTQFGQQLNLIDFEVDRYELDRFLTKNWDPVYDSTQGSWIPNPPQLTTFDVLPHYQLPVPNDSSFVFVGGLGYAVGDQILVLGSQIGGVNSVNDVVITVEEVDSFGTIQQARAVGTAPLLTVGDTYINIVGTNITGTGSGATWDLIVTGGDPTTFDHNSLQFIAPVDMYGNTQIYDKYLVFPKRNILQ